jgi:allantoate deiminase
MHDCETLAREVIARCKTLAQFTEVADSIHRTFLSPPMRDCHLEIAKWVAPLGVASKVDAAGNLRITYPADKVGSRVPRLLIGSHLDTVPNAGAYDGVLGVVIAIAVLRAINGRRFPFAIEVIGFSEEEGVRFGTPFIGSRALMGTLNDEVLKRRDARGISMGEAIAEFGLDPKEISDAALPDDVVGFLEFHIEQGPILENTGRSLGVVEVIAGQSRLTFRFIGKANHAGTTPMNLRHDAIAAAAAWIGAVEGRAKSVQDLVATVGAIRVKPGVGNVIAGEAELSLDVRHRDDEVRNAAVDYLIDEAEHIANNRGLKLETVGQLNQRAVAMDPFLSGQIAEAMRKTGCEPYRMVSGAGHDAMIMATKIPSAMIFLRTPGGVSHDPAESVRVEDVAKAIDCGVTLLEQLASSSKFLSLMPRTQRA